MADSTNKGAMQGQDWSGEMGDKWNLNIDCFEGMIAPIGEATIGHARLQPGEKVLDIGCGGGPTTLEIARRVAPTGSVLGLDISPALVATARQRAQQAGLANATFECVDAATAELPERDYDVLFSRFGVMFFTDPVAAFTNMHGMLKPGARAVFACWGPPPENPWVANLQQIVARYITLPPPDPTAPGPFAFANQERTTGILQQAGFSGVEFATWRGEQLYGGPGMDPDGAAEFSMKTLFLGDLLAEQPDEIKDKVVEDAKAMFRQHQTPEGILLGGMSWLVTARA